MAQHEFVHLHNHTEYSLLDGLARATDLVSAAAGDIDQNDEKCQRAIAVTDHGAMYAAMEFYTAAQAAGINPIIGCEVYVAPGKRGDRTKNGGAFHLVLLAKDDTGYRNLVQLASLAHLEGFYYKPRVDRELLERHHEGLIAMSACPSGEVARAILAGDLAGARAVADWYHQVFGQDNYYLELQRHNLPELHRIGPEIVRMSREMGIPLVATNDTHYVRQDEAYAQELLLAIQTNNTMDDPKRLRMEANTFYLRTAREMHELFSDVPEALRNTMEIASRCNLKMEFDRVQLPVFEIPEGYTPDSWLETNSFQGLRQRLNGEPPQHYVDRLRYELEVIQKTGFATYILIVADFVEAARNKGILFGPRGSAAGALVCYCLRIGDIDPVANNLVFERFLNLERREMPDIDMDFADDRRDEMIAYAAEKYGRDHVGQIITFGTLGARAAIRDVGRALGINIANIDRVAKMVPGLPVGMTIEKALAANREFRQAYNEDDTVHNLVDTARKVEGVARHASTHAAGVVISREPLINHVPLQRTNRDEQAVMTQYPMDVLAKIGLLKMDFLGLSNLSILGRTIETIRQTQGRKIDLANLPLDDPRVFKMLGEGETTGIFQLEGSGMRRYIKELKPTSVADIAAMVALYRPGPMESIPRFIKGKSDPSSITYDHPLLEPILKDTYGVLVYQDQVLQIVQVVAGYTMGNADILRKAMGKKVPEIMRKERSNFLAGAKAKGLTEQDAGHIFDVIEPFAGYAFNKAHAYCYAHVAYQTAYFKVNYPVEYMSSVLNAALGTLDKVAIAAAESRRLGLELLPPDVNHSQLGFSVEGPQGIRFGLGAIKNVGQAPAEAIISARQSGGPFASVDDFCRRVDARVVHKRVVESLIKVGALDVLGRRSQLLDALDRILGDVQRQQRAAANGQGSIFDLMGGDISAKEVQTLALPDIPEAPNETLLTWEKELLGISFTEHPLNQVLVKMRRHTTAFCSSISTDMKGQRVTMVGVLTNPRQVTTKKGDSMVISRLEDLEGGVDLVVFPRTFQQTAEVWQPDAIVVVEARVDVREDRAQLVCEKARLYSEPEAEEDGPVVAQVAEKREAYPGDDYPPQDDNWYPVEDDVSFDTLPPGDSPHPSPFPEGEGTQLEASSAGEGPAISPQRGEPQRGALPADEAYPHPSPLPEGEGTPRGAGPNGEGSRPGHGSRKLYITFRRTGDEARDMRIFHETLALLRHHPGNDPVGLTIITNAGLAVDMEWPDLMIRYSRQLEAQLADVVGTEGLRLASGPAGITGV